MTMSITRRAFVGTTAGGVLGTAVCSLSTAASASGGRAPTPPDLVLDASAPLAAPARGFDAFRSELHARRAAGFDVVFVPVANREDMEGTLRNLLALSSHLGRLADEAVLVSRPEDLSQLRPRTGIVAHLQGLQMIGEQVHMIRQLRDGGVTVMQLTGYWKNWNGDGCLERGDNPLTGLGRMVVRAIADAGVVLDLAQAGRRTSLEALELTTSGSVIVSRANAAFVHPHPQNLTDNQIDAVQRQGGVIGLTAFPPLLSAAARPSIEDVLRHLRHLVDRAGIDHVAIGLDFDDRGRRRFSDDPLPDPPYAYPVGLASAADLPGFRNHLAAEGYAAADLQKLFGGNLARVLEHTLAAAVG